MPQRNAALTFEPDFRDVAGMPQRQILMSGKGVPGLKSSLLELCRKEKWPLLEPLPVTRFLGESFGVSNVSAYRVLSALCASGHLWRAPNGRYFLPGAQRLLEKPAPIACLFRRLERWTEVGREMMLGVDEECGELERAMLLIHDRVLFRQSNPISPTATGSHRELHQAMEDFLTVHADRISGIVLDEIWPDRVLAGFQNRLRSAVVVYRRTKLPFLGCVSADAASAARLAVEHAAARGFERLDIVLPFRGYHPSDEMAEAIRAAAKGRFPEPKIFFTRSSAAMRQLVSAVRRQRRRILLVGTEDNAASAALQALALAGIRVPDRVGVLSAMGSRIALDNGITSAGFDFRKMGQEAVRMAASGRLRELRLPAALIPGTTT